MEAVVEQQERLTRIQQELGVLLIHIQGVPKKSEAAVFLSLLIEYPSQNMRTYILYPLKCEVKTVLSSTEPFLSDV